MPAGHMHFSPIPRSCGECCPAAEPCSGSDVVTAAGDWTSRRHLATDPHPFVHALSVCFLCFWKQQQQHTLIGGGWFIGTLIIPTERGGFEERVPGLVSDGLNRKWQKALWVRMPGRQWGTWGWCLGIINNNHTTCGWEAGCHVSLFILF